MSNGFTYEPLPAYFAPKSAFRPYTRSSGPRPGAFPLEKRGDNYRWQFAVWAPHAASVSLVGDFNGWDAAATPMREVGNGLWATEAELPVGAIYKYCIHTPDGRKLLKADPCAFYAELRPGTASRTWTDSFRWTDGEWRRKQTETSGKPRPLFIYEVHLGSWRQDGGEFYNYRRLADELAPYALSLGATHVEILPVAEHPLDMSWGYQCTGYFAPTSRYGTPEDFKYFVNTLHRHGLGVILDWVPAHFPKDAHGLRQFDGVPLFEYGNEAYAEHRDWGTLRFDLGNVQVRDFLLASALHWLKEYHIDGLRVDAVSSMLYLDFGRDKFSPNRKGGREDLEAVEFLRLLNREVRRKFPHALMIAEEATAFPNVTGDPEESLGFHYKWNMGWMHDSLAYMQTPAQERKFAHAKLTFPLMYAFDEQFILPLSHDECVHGKKSFIEKMSGAYEEKFALLRAYYAYMFTHPGKKLLFMGGEFAQFIEWRYAESLDWFLEQYDSHRGMLAFVKTLGNLYKSEPALWDDEAGWAGFSWVQVDDADRNVIAYTRTSRETGESLLVVINFSTSFYQNYRLHPAKPVQGTLILNSDRKEFYGSGYPAAEQVQTKRVHYPEKPWALDVTLPPLSALIYRLEDVENAAVLPETLAYPAI